MPFWGHFDVHVTSNISQTLTTGGSGLMFSECSNKILFWLSWKSGRICSKFFQTKTNSAARNRTLGNQLLMSLCTELDYKGFSKESPRSVGISTACLEQEEIRAYH